VALLRLTVIGLVACQAATAAPGAALIAAHDPPPPGWTQVPAIAAAVAMAAGADPAASSLAVDAWGDPAAGCYAVWLELRGAAGDAPALADQVIGGLTGLTLTDVARPTATAGVLAFTFARPPYHGRLHAQLAQGQIAATACFGNEREPAACDTTCARVLHDVR
jgi:hypothetical protein